MLYPKPQLFNRYRRTQFEYLDVYRPDERLQRREIDHTSAGWTVIASWILHIMKMQTYQMFGQRLEMEAVMNEADVLFDLRMAGVMPVTNRGIRKVFE